MAAEWLEATSELFPTRVGLGTTGDLAQVNARGGQLTMAGSAGVNYGVLTA